MHHGELEVGDKISASILDSLLPFFFWSGRLGTALLAV